MVGNVDFVVVVRNDGTESADVSVLPIRHYSDGETNDSALDEMSATIPPDAAPHQVWHSYEIQSNHTIVSCEARISSDAGTEVVNVPAR